MAQLRSDNILADLPKVLDDHCGVFDGVPPKWRPYNNVAEFQSRFPNIGVAETQMFWVRSTTNANNADLYSLRKDKTPYKVFDDIDLSNYYTIEEVNGLIENEAILREAADEINALAIETEKQRALAIEATKADSNNITSARYITYDDLDPATHTTFVDINYANKVVRLDNLVSGNINNVYPDIQFDSNGVLIIPFTPDSLFEAYLIGTLGDLSNYLAISSISSPLILSNLFNKNNFRDNTIISTVNGSIATADGCQTTNDIDIPDGLAFISWSGLSETVHRIAFFDDTNTFISPVLLPSTIEGTVEIPANAAWFRFMFKHPADTEDLAATFILVFGSTIEKPVNIVISSDFDFYPAGTQYFEKDKFEDGYIDPTTFEEVSSSPVNYMRTGFIRCKPFTQYTASGMATDNYGRGVAFYNENKTLLGGILTPIDTSEFTITTIANSAYWKFTFKTNDPDDHTTPDDVMVNEGDTAEAYENYENGISKIQGYPLVSGNTGSSSGGTVDVPTKDKRAGLFGDSITETININGFARQNWPVFADPILQWDRTDTNYAKSGAGFVHTVAPTYPEQWLSVQIQHAIDDAIDFDIIVVSLLTNDLNKTLGSYDTAMSKAIGDLDLTIVMESARSCFYTIRENWPEAICYYALPLQRASMELEAMLPYVDGVRKMAQRYGFMIIEATYDSGIIKDFETVGVNGRYLSDGLHPNPAGQTLQSKCYVSKILNTYKSY